MCKFVPFHQTNLPKGRKFYISGRSRYASYMGYGKSRWWFDIFVDVYSEGLRNDDFVHIVSGDSTTN